MADILTMLWLVIISWFIIELINSRLSRSRKQNRTPADIDSEK